MREKKFSDRLLTLREKFPGVSQTEMATHFGIKRSMYARYENGKVEPEAFKKRKMEQRMEFLERLEKLPPLIKEIPENSEAEKSKEVYPEEEKLIDAYKMVYELTVKIARLEKTIEDLTLAKRRVNG